MKALVAALTAVLLLAGCGDGQKTAAKPAPVVPDREAITYFDHMILVDHQGPKAQIILTSAVKEGKGPLWFPSVRDAVAFTKLPDEPKDIAAIYVTDMAKTANWDDPTEWMAPEKAVFVIESDMRGGMGAPEAVPFSERAAAEAFVHGHGGRIVAWADIPEDYVLSDAEATMKGEGMGGPGITTSGPMTMNHGSAR
jgi:copper chaperone NosL